MKRQPVDPYNGPYTLGIDVSKWNGKISWTDLPKGVKFVFIRTGDGKDVDEKFDYNWQAVAALKDGPLQGSYHYFRADRGGEAQAELVLKTLEKAGGWRDGNLPPVLDLEGGSRKNLPDGLVQGRADLPIAIVAEECLKFLGMIEKELSVTPIIYTGQSFHWWLSQSFPALASKFAKYPLWLPSYTTKPMMPVDVDGRAFPWDHWTFWQYTSDGLITGIDGSVDLNYFRGTVSELVHFNNSSRIKTPPQPEESELVFNKAPLLEEYKTLMTRCHEIVNLLAKN